MNSSQFVWHYSAGGFSKQENTGPILKNLITERKLLDRFFRRSRAFIDNEYDIIIIILIQVVMEELTTRANFL